MGNKRRLCLRKRHGAWVVKSAQRGNHEEHRRAEREQNGVDEYPGVGLGNDTTVRCVSWRAGALGTSTLTRGHTRNKHISSY